MHAWDAVQAATRRLALQVDYLVESFTMPVTLERKIPATPPPTHTLFSWWSLHDCIFLSSPLRHTTLSSFSALPVVVSVSMLRIWSLLWDQIVEATTPWCVSDTREDASGICDCSAAW